MKKLLLLFILASSIQGCVEPDTEAPILSLNSINPGAGQGLVCGQPDSRVIAIESGDTISATLVLSDNENLSQYKVDLHSNFDCHGHAKPATNTEDWYLIDIQDVSGKTAEVELELFAPNNVTSGTYHFGVQATDAAGNNSESTLYSVNVVNTSDLEAPVLIVNTPSEPSFTMANGDAILFEGSVTDNQLLNSGGNGLIEVRYWNITNGTVSILAERSLGDIASETYNFSFPETIPQTLVSGSYIFEVRAFDGVNNPSNTVEFSVVIN